MKSRSKASVFFLWSTRLALWGACALAIVAIVIAALIAVAVQRLPNYEVLQESPAGQTIRIFAADGSLLQSLGPSYGQWLSLEEIPPVMREAMIAVEDRRFYHHPGVDPVGIARASWVGIKNFGSGRRLQGASTITQQVARTAFLSNDYNLKRKGREMILAFALEWKFSKEQILELYLNKIYFGGGSYGVDAASRRFFGHSATEMSITEAAIIAGLAKAPSRYAPTANIEAARSRGKVVLSAMVDVGFLTPVEAERAVPPQMKIVKPSGDNSVYYFNDWVLPRLSLFIRESKAPLDVHTTLDPKMQQQAVAALSKHAPKGAQAALVALDRDGAVRAMVGGLDYLTSNYNRATVAKRQSGSAWKLFVYLTALESGYGVNDMVIDSPITIDKWSPRNSNGRYLGRITLREAFSRSVNTVAAKLGSDVGFTNIANMARRMGIATSVNVYPSMVLGTADVRLLDMTHAFASVGQGGLAIAPYGISRVEIANGKILYQRKKPSDRRLIDPWVAGGMTDLLQAVVKSGTGRAAQIGRPTAGKTGTTSSNKDGWFLGFSSGLTTGVWVGRDDAKRVRGLQGGRAPARAFAAFMKPATAERPIEYYETLTTPPQWRFEDDENAYLGTPDDRIFDEWLGEEEAEPQRDF